MQITKLKEFKRKRKESKREVKLPAREDLTEEFTEEKEMLMRTLRHQRERLKNM